MTLEEQYKAKEAEMLKTCSKQSHKRHRLIFEMQEIYRTIKQNRNNELNLEVSSKK